MEEDEVDVNKPIFQQEKRKNGGDIDDVSRWNSGNTAKHTVS